jgi:hypothetical protein
VLRRLEAGRSVPTVAAETDADRETVQRLTRMRAESEHKREPAPTPGLR